MGPAPASLNEVIREMLALQKALPPRPSFPELDLAIAAIAAIAEDDLSVRQDELLRQPKPKDVPPSMFGALQEMRAEAAEGKAKERKHAAEAIVELEERHHRHDGWIRRAHAALSSIALASGEDSDVDGPLIFPASKEDDKQVEIVGSARSVLVAVWDFPPSESSVASSAGVISSSVDDSPGAKPHRSKSSSHCRSDSFSSVVESLSWTGEAQPKLDAGSEVPPSPGRRGDLKNYEGNSLVLRDVKNTFSALSMLDLASKQMQTSLDLRGAFLKEIEWVPESIGKMSWLTDLNLSGNRLTILPDSIGDLANLVSLDVCTNQLVALPETIGQLTCLKTLSIDNNMIEELPWTIGQCTALIELKVSFNQLKALPEATGKLMQLRCIDVHWNKLSRLPITMASMENLVDLDASFNEIQYIPEGLCHVTTLTRLNLASNFNELKELPQQIRNLQKLKVLNLSCNQLKILPNSFAFLTA